MDENKDFTEEEARWADNFSPDPKEHDEILPDETAIYSAGLTHPDDLEFERIFQELKDEALLEDPVSDMPTAVVPIPDQEYSDAFEDQTAPEPEAASEPKKKRRRKKEAELLDPNARKGRPRRKKGYGLLGIPHILVTGVWLAVILVIGISLGRIVWLCAADVLAFGREYQEVSITIQESDTLETISEKLKNAGLIRYPGLFQLYGDVANVRGKIGVGTFTLNSLYDYHALVNFMNTYSSSREVVQVVVPEGYSCAQMFRLLEEKGVCTVSELEEYAANGELDDYWFLEGVERGTPYCLEGYLFPDTYQFYTNDDPERVLEKFLDDFEYRFSLVMIDSIPELNERISQMMARHGYGQDYIDAHQYTIREIVIIASMIQKETASNIESYTISSVIYNRLTNAANYPYLNVDATIIYALGGGVTSLSAQDLELDSPYNTYKYPGLTPGPICNPGLACLTAALDPDDTDYYYYALDPSAGSHHFSKTAQDHADFLASLGG